MPKTKLSERELLLKQQKKLQKKSAEQKAAKKNKALKLCTVFGITAVVLIVIIIGSNLLLDSGVLLRGTVVYRTEHAEINNAVFSYVFYDKYNDFKRAYNGSLDTVSLDETKSLKDQDCTLAQGSWFDYFSSAASDEIRTVLYFYEASAADGYTLTSEDKESITAKLNEISVTASAADMSIDAYISKYFGRGVKISDIEGYLTLKTASGHYSEDYISSFDFPQEKYDENYETYSDYFKTADYMYYGFDAKLKENPTATMTQAEIEKALADAKALAEKLATECHTEQQFLDWVESYVKTENPDITEDAITEILNGCYQERYINDDGVEMNTWLMGNEKDGTIPAKYGDTDIEDYGNTWTAYMCLKPVGELDYTTKNATIITLTEKTYGENAEKIASEIVAGVKDGISIEEYAKQYSETRQYNNIAWYYKASAPEIDRNRPSECVFTNSYCRGILKFDRFDETEAWLYDSARKAGDCASFKTDGGYKVIYFEGDFLPAWKSIMYNVFFKDGTPMLDALNALYPMQCDEAATDMIPA